MKANLKILAIVLLISLGSGARAGSADQVPALTNFTAGTPALAEEVNSNFAAVQSAVNNNDARLVALEALAAATVQCPATTPERFTDNGDGTVCDSQTGLMWEKKVTDIVNPSNPNSVANGYSWTRPAMRLPRTARCTAIFSPRLNGEIATTATGTEQLAGYRDWRLPTLAELLTIADCSFQPVCINPTFGPTDAAAYWTSTTNPTDATYVWAVYFNNGSANNTKKNLATAVRARVVRNGR